MIKIYLGLTALGIVIITILAIFIHHGITHPEEKDFFKRWFDVEDFVNAFKTLGASHGGIVLALILFSIGLML